MGKHVTVDKFCVGCGDPFKSRNRGGDRGWTRYCSNTCRAQTDHYKGGAAASRRRRRYGMEPEDYAAMLSEQDGKCALCRADPPYDLYVDHHHETKENRGLLCAKCNSAVAVFDWLTWDEVLTYWGYTNLNAAGRRIAARYVDEIAERGDMTPFTNIYPPKTPEVLYNDGKQVGEDPGKVPPHIGTYPKVDMIDGKSMADELIAERRAEALSEAPQSPSKPLPAPPEGSRCCRRWPPCGGCSDFRTDL